MAAEAGSTDPSAGSDAPDFDAAAFGLPTSFGGSATAKPKPPPAQRGRGGKRGGSSRSGRGEGGKGSRRPRTSEGSSAEPDGKLDAPEAKGQASTSTAASDVSQPGPYAKYFKPAMLLDPWRDLS